MVGAVPAMITCNLSGEGKMLSKMLSKIPGKYKKPKWVIAIAIAVTVLIWMLYSYFSVPAGQERSPTDGLDAIEGGARALSGLATGSGLVISPPMAPPTPVIPVKYRHAELALEWESCYEQMLETYGNQAQQELAGMIDTINIIAANTTAAIPDPVEEAVFDDVERAARDLLWLLEDKRCNEAAAGIYHRIPGRTGWLIGQAKLTSGIEEPSTLTPTP